MRLCQSWSCSQVSIFNISAWEVLVFAQTLDYSLQSIHVKNCPLNVWHTVWTDWPVYFVFMCCLGTSVYDSGLEISSLLAVSLLANLWSIYSLRKRAFHLYPWPPCHHRFSCPGRQCPLVAQWALTPKSGCHKHAWRKTKTKYTFLCIFFSCIALLHSGSFLCPLPFVCDVWESFNQESTLVNKFSEV